MPQYSIVYIRVSVDDLTLVRQQGDTLAHYCHKMNRRVSFTLNLREALSAAPAAITAGVQQVALYLSTPATLVPLGEFNESDAEVLYRAATADSVRRRVLFDALPSLGYVLLYGVSENVCKAVEEAFPHTTFHNALLPLLQRREGVDGEGVTLQVYVHEDQTDALCWQGRKLMALNTFTTRHTDDATFFLLGMVEALAIPADSLTVKVAGEARKQQAVVQSLLRFVSSAEAIGDSRNALPYDLAQAVRFEVQKA